MPSLTNDTDDENKPKQPPPPPAIVVDEPPPPPPTTTTTIFHLHDAANRRTQSEFIRGGGGGGDGADDDDATTTTSPTARIDGGGGDGVGPPEWIQQQLRTHSFGPASTYMTWHHPRSHTQPHPQQQHQYRRRISGAPQQPHQHQVTMPATRATPQRKMSPAPKSPMIDFHANLLANALFVPQSLHVSSHSDSPIDNIKRVLARKGRFQRPALFCEMLYCNTEHAADDDHDNQLYWRQTNRWMRYEQCVEGSHSRFSKPFVTLLGVQPLLQIKACLRKGVVILDAPATDFVRICDMLTQQWVANGFLEQEYVRAVKDVLFAPKLHLIRSKMRRAIDSAATAIGAGGGESKRSSVFHQSSMSVASEFDEEDAHRYGDGDEKLLRKLPTNTEAAVIFAGRVPDLGLGAPLTGFVRLKHSSILYPECPDHPLPVRFLFVLLNPQENYHNETQRIGRTMGALFSDEADEMAIEELCKTDSSMANLADHLAGGKHALPSGIARTGRPFGGLVKDIKTKLRWYPSDFADFFRGRISQSIAATVLIFFANITNIITFGAVMERALHHQMAAIENILSGAISGVLFGLFSGQPLNILSATGPTLVFERILYDFCSKQNWEFLPFRFYVGCWTSLYLLLLVATDASSLVGLISRFTEEAFATLIAVVFIVQSIEKVAAMGKYTPESQDCFCLVPTGGLIGGVHHYNPSAGADAHHTNQHHHSSSHHHHHQSSSASSSSSSPYMNMSVGFSRCMELGGTPAGIQCVSPPNVLMFSIILTATTFLIAYTLSNFRHSRYLTFRARNLVSDFGILIAIITGTILVRLGASRHVRVPSLRVPDEFRPTMERSWMVDVTDIDGPGVALFAALPAAFYTILLVMDQQITAVIVNRKDNKLKKGVGYHLDLLLITIIVIISSLFGLPIYVAATVLSIMHVDALKVRTDCVTPGETQKTLGVKEQRLTTVIAHLLIGASIFLTPLLKLVPLPVLTGIFLYMGLVTLMGQQFVQRLMLFFIPIKYQPDYAWLRTVQMKRVHLFTVIQIFSIGSLFVIKYAFKTISMIFPLMVLIFCDKQLNYKKILVVMVFIRMFVLSKIFTKQELNALDDPVPRFSDVVRPRPKLHKHSPKSRLFFQPQQQPQQQQQTTMHNSASSGKRPLLAAESASSATKMALGSTKNNGVR